MQLQQFLRFANFYRQFIRHYSKVAAPLTEFTSTRLPFSWTKRAKVVFSHMGRFTSAPVLAHTDPAGQFVVEVDASDTGVGVVLSQLGTTDGNLHPSMFFSRHLSPPESIYDVGNRELLALVMALQEWRHWLEGASEQFFLWTDHKNFAYLCGAKRLNSRQAR